MTKQINNVIDVGIVYEWVVGLIEKLHKTIRVVITEKSWREEEETETIMIVQNQGEATKVQNLLYQEVGTNKEIIVKVVYV